MLNVRFYPNSDRSANIPKTSRSANSRQYPLQASEELLYGSPKRYQRSMPSFGTIGLDGAVHLRLSA
jgi:hypothetical protein